MPPLLNTRSTPTQFCIFDLLNMISMETFLLQEPVLNSRDARKLVMLISGHDTMLCNLELSPAVLLGMVMKPGKHQR